VTNMHRGQICACTKSMRKAKQQIFRFGLTESKCRHH
jgi:hypothetical protein